MDAGLPGWVEATCRIAEVWRSGELSIRQLFEQAAPDLHDESRAREWLWSYLVRNPSLVQRWQGYCSDRRGSPAPYLRGMEVGFLQGGYQDVTTHDDEVSACADYICREATWVLQRRRLAEGHSPETQLVDAFAAARPGAVVRRGSEAFIAIEDAADFIAKAELSQFRILGLEGFMVSDAFVYPALSRIADFSGIRAVGESAAAARALVTGSWRSPPGSHDQISREATGRHMVVVVIARSAAHDHQ